MITNFFITQAILIIQDLKFILVGLRFGFSSNLIQSNFPIEIHNFGCFRFNSVQLKRFLNFLNSQLIREITSAYFY